MATKSPVSFVSSKPTSIRLLLNVGGLSLKSIMWTLTWDWLDRVGTPWSLTVTVKMNWLLLCKFDSKSMDLLRLISPVVASILKLSLPTSVILYFNLLLGAVESPSVADTVRMVRLTGVVSKILILYKGWLNVGVLSLTSLRLMTISCEEDRDRLSVAITSITC